MGGLLLLFGCATTSGVQGASSEEVIAVITDIQIEDGNIVIKSNRDFTYTLYSADDPYKTTVEIPDMTIGTFSGRITPDKSVVTEILPQQLDSPHIAVKIDIVLQKPSTLSPLYKDNTLILSLNKDQPVVLSDAREPEAKPEAKELETRPEVAPLPAVAETPVKAVKAVAETVQSQETKATEIRTIEIRKAEGTVKIFITGNGAMVPNVFPVNERIVVDIPDVLLKAALPENVISPLKGIRAGKHKDKVRLVLDLKEKTNFDVSALGNTLEISLLPKDAVTKQVPADTSPKAVATSAVVSSPKPLQPAPEPERLTDGEFTGKKVSLDFQDADIIPIFRLLGDISGYNMVITPAVKGNITLKLINVPWDQALDIILRTFSLSKLVDGNIIRIVPTSVVAKELDEITRAKKARDEAGDLKTKIFPVNYADLAKLKDAIDKAKVISSRGSITLDERASAFIINDLETNLAQIDVLIRQLDQEQIQARQVMIEAKIIEVSSTYSKDLGIQWGAFLKTPQSTGDHNYTIAPFGRTSTSSTSPPGNYMVNLPSTLGQTGRIGFGYINRAATFALDLQLSAMEQLQKGKIISSPRVMTMNNQEAKITSGSTIYLQSTASGSNLASFTAVDATLSLSVKPRIAPGGAIFMDVHITKDEPGPSVGDQVSILKNEVTTSVLINDGETIVIGGIFKQSETGVEDGIPGLSKLPGLLGRLFRKDNKVEDNRESLVFITPRILEFNGLK